MVFDTATVHIYMNIYSSTVRTYYTNIIIVTLSRKTINILLYFYSSCSGKIVFF